MNPKSDKMQVAAFTLGTNVPSARARVRQYIGLLNKSGIAVTEHPLPWGNSLPKSVAVRPLWMAGTLAARITSLALARRAQASWVSRQLLPAFVSADCVMRKPFVLDVDDAVWLTTGGHRAKRLAERAAAVVCGNHYIARYFSQWNRRIAIIPTGIDTIKYRAASNATDEPNELLIGWTGTSQNYPYLYAIEDALQETLARFKRAKLLVVAERPPRLNKLPNSQVEFVQWTPTAELEAIARMSIGLMPLDDSDWCRGKCSFKMLCYMAFQIPVVVSPVGMNSDVLRQGEVGFGAKTREDWVSALSTLIEDRNLRHSMGHHGRSVVESSYSVDKLVNRYSDIFHSLEY